MPLGHAGGGRRGSTLDALHLDTGAVVLGSQSTPSGQTTIAGRAARDARPIAPCREEREAAGGDPRRGGCGGGRRPRLSRLVDQRARAPAAGGQCPGAGTIVAVLDDIPAGESAV